MKTLAVVNFEKCSIDQAWELLDRQGDANPFLVLQCLEGGDYLVIPLLREHLKRIGGLAGADRNYDVPLNASDAVRIKPGLPNALAQKSC